MMTPQLQCFMKPVADRINARDSLSLNTELAFLMFTKFVKKLTIYTTSETAV